MCHERLDTDYLLFVDEVMANILHLAHNMDDETCAPGAPAPDTSPPPISAFVAAGRGLRIGRGHYPVALVVVVAFPTSAAHVAAWTTYCPHALPRKTPF
jgi:hypothetical protein